MVLGASGGGADGIGLDCLGCTFKVRSWHPPVRRQGAYPSPYTMDGLAHSIGDEGLLVPALLCVSPSGSTLPQAVRVLWSRIQ